MPKKKPSPALPVDCRCRNEMNTFIDTYGSDLATQKGGHLLALKDPERFCGLCARPAERFAQIGQIVLAERQAAA